MRSIVVSLFLTLMVAGCGGGTAGDSADTDSTSTLTSPDAVLGVLLTDDPSDDIEQFLATISKIELLGEDRSFTVFEGSAAVDLLQLPDFYELFTVTSVTPGTYDRVRFQLSDVTVVSENDSGALVQTVVTLPSSTIEVAPEESFTIDPGQVLFLEIDFDIDKALEMMVEEGGELLLEPVIFVAIEQRLPATRFVRLHGVVDAFTDGGLRLCDTQLLSKVDSNRRGLGACADVRIDEHTSVFGADGIPTDLATVMVGDAITLVGHINRRTTSIPAIPNGHLPPPGECRLWFTDRTTGDQPPPVKCEDIANEALPANAVALNDRGLPLSDIFGADALVIEVGDRATFSRLRGKAATAVTEEGQFSFQISGEPAAETDNPLTAILFPETRIFSINGQEHGAQVIQPELQAILDGVLVRSATEGDSIRVSFVVAKLDEGQQQRLTGTVLSVEANSLVMATETGDRCVEAGRADVFVVNLVEGRMVTEEVTLDALETDQPINVFGAEGAEGCFAAKTIIADGL